MTPSSPFGLVLLAVSATVQCFAAVAALRLLYVTRHRLGWGLLTAALAMMAVRRALPLWRALTQPTPWPIDLTSELLGLTISVIICAGLVALTQRARAARQHLDHLEHIADRYRTVFEHHPAVMLLVDPATATIVDANPAAAAYYGYPRERLRHAPVSLLHVDADPHTGARGAATGGPPSWITGQTMEARHRLASGAMRDVDVLSGVLDTEKGRLLCVVVHDAGDRGATERTRAELAAFPEYNPSPTLRVDADGRVVLANPAARHSGLAVGTRLASVVPAVGDLDLGLLIAQNGTQVLEASLGGRTLQLTLRGLAERGVANVYTSDVTELKRAEDALRAGNDELRRWVGELERHRHDSDVHIELGALLQSCESVEEAGHVIERLVPSLFPESSGAIFLDLPQTSVLQCIGQWGAHAPGATTFHRDTCWAVRRGQLHAVEQVHTGLACPHLLDGYQGFSMCLPLRAQGAMPGILTLRGEGKLLDASGQRQARLLADTVGLAIVNLRLRESLREQSIRDGLTGLFNRRYLEETLAREVARAGRERAPLSLLMIDLDHFKLVNDTYGHSAGDRVLQAVADMLQRQVRSADIVCRYGGEEFAVLMPDTATDHAVARAEDLRRSAQALELPGPAADASLSMSVGVATYPAHGRRAADLVRASDAALYAAKRHGRNRVETPPPSETPAQA